MFSSSASQAGGAALAVEDAFAANIYTGNGTSQTITNGVDLLGQGGLCWTKRRDTTADHFLRDSAIDSGFGSFLVSNSTDAAGAGGSFTPLSTGFSLGASGAQNASGGSFAAWTFRQAPGFFDVLTYTGNESVNTIPHSLGAAPGAIFIKRLNNSNFWTVYHRSVGSGAYLVLNAADAAASSAIVWNSTTPTATDFQLGDFGGETNRSAPYVAYLFGHDSSADGVIQCGSFSTDGSGAGSFTHGWAEGAQYVMLKAVSTTGDWEVFDRTRTSGWSGSDARLLANTSAAEDTVSRLSESGTTLSFAGLSASTDYIFMIIRAPA